MFKGVWVSLLRPLRSGWAIAALLILAFGFAAGTVASGEPGESVDPTISTSATDAANAATVATTSTGQQPPATVTEAAPPGTATQPVSPTTAEPDADHTKTSTSTSTSPEPATPNVAVVPVEKTGAAKHDNFDSRDHGSVIPGPLSMSGTGEAGTDHFCAVPKPKHDGRRGEGPPRESLVTWEVQGGPFDASVVTQLPIGTPFVPERSNAGQWLRCSVTAASHHHGPPKVLRSDAVQITSAPFFTDPDADVLLSGDGLVGAPVQCTAPQVSGFPEPAVEFVWMLLGPGDEYVPLGSGPVFTPTTTQAGEHIFCGIRISNDLGETTVFNRITLLVSGPAVNVVAPSVNAENTRPSGQTLTCDEGDWDSQGEPEYSYRYTWRLNGAEIPGAGAKTYSAVQTGSYSCSVVVVNARGASEPAISPAIAVTIDAEDDLSSYYSTPPPPAATIPAAGSPSRPKSPSQASTAPASAVAAAPDAQQADEKPPKAKRKPTEESAEPAEQVVLGASAQSGLRDSPYGLVNAERSHIATSVPKPGDLNLNGKKVATGSLLALLMVALLGLPAAIFNETAERHHDLISGWMDKPRALLAALFGWIPLWGTTVGTLGASAVITTGICAFLSPGFPSAPGSWQFLIGMLIGMSVVGLVFFLTWHWYIKHFLPESVGHWELYPLFALVAIVLVVVSRLAHFVPGVILGTIAEYEPSRPLSKMHEGRRVALTFGSMLVLALACWLLWIPVSEQANVVGCSNVWLVLDAALSVGFVTGLETTVFGLLPLRFLDGHDLLAWKRWLWALMWGTGVVWFSFVIADPAVGGYGRHTDSEIPMLLGLLGVTTIIAAATWTIFYRRHRKAESASDISHRG